MSFYLGLVDGRKPGYFDPDAQVTRQEAAMYTWGILQGKEDGSFDPQGPFTREQCLLTFLRLYEDAPVSRKNGNVEPMFNYQQVMEVLEKHVHREEKHLMEFSRWEGPTATVIRQLSQGPVFSVTRTFFVYQDGRIFTCTAVLTGDSTAGNGSGIGVVVHRTGLYHITVDVETLEVSQTWEPLPA